VSAILETTRVRITFFTVHFDIEAHRGGRIEVRHFESGQSFASDAKAIEAGLQMGQQKIDSNYGLSVLGFVQSYRVWCHSSE
jgi:hypothetical protein